MADIIQLLPDSIANQIAAGEVIQRPASVIKELLENAIDAKCTEIKVILKNAGKTLIQVIDNGVGMSDTDARMSFERHATSKIKQANDLFHIRTKGFRGEALASIAAIAQVELVTRQEEEELGRIIQISGSEVKKHEPCQANTGSTFSVKNLFFNVPARRKFLKSDPVELRHIVEEFRRVALAHPEVAMSIYHNDNEVYILPKGNQRQRVVGVFGRNVNEKLIPISEETDIISLEGFVGKPEAAKKTKGDQYLFVNRRYIKSNYFNHAIKMVYEDLIPKESHPLYCIFMEIDPSEIDINIHPTKTEVKFEQEKIIYNYIRVASKKALGKYYLTPTLDFENDYNFNQRDHSKTYKEINNEYRFATEKKMGKEDWNELYGVLNTPTENIPDQGSLFGDVLQPISEEEGNVELLDVEYTQIHNSYILVHTDKGYLLIDQQAAHERILYEHNLKKLKGSPALTQKQLFPIQVNLDKVKSELLQSILGPICRLGFDIQHFGGETFLIHGNPVELDNVDAAKIIDELLDAYTSNMEMNLNSDENISQSLAYSGAIKRGKKLTSDEMNTIVEELFSCDMPYSSPRGRKCYVDVTLDSLFKRFEI